MKISTTILACSLIGIHPALVMGTPIAEWNFGSGASDTQTAAVVDPNAAASNFVLSSGSITFPQGNPTSGDAISGIGWDATSPTAIGAQWWEFTVTANAGYVLDLTSLTFDDKKSTYGPVNWSITVNGLAADSGNTHSSFSSTTPMNTASLSAFQDLTTVDVMIYGFGATDSRGTWRLDNVALNGSVIPVPSVPDSIPCLAGLGCALGLLAVFRRTSNASRPLTQRRV